MEDSVFSLAVGSISSTWPFTEAQVRQEGKSQWCQGFPQQPAMFSTPESPSFGVAGQWISDLQHGADHSSVCPESRCFFFEDLNEDTESQSTEAQLLDEFDAMKGNKHTWAFCFWELPAVEGLYVVRHTESGFSRDFSHRISLGEIRSRYFWWSIENQPTGGLLEVVDKDYSWKGQMVRKACGNGNIRKRPCLVRWNQEQLSLEQTVRAAWALSKKMAKM